AHVPAPPERPRIGRQRLDRRARGVHHRAARRLVDPARLHADEAILDEVDPADAVLAGDLVEPGQHLDRAEPLAVDRDRVAALELDLEDARLGRRVLGIARALEHLRIGLAPRILEHAALVAGVQQVAIDRVRLVDGGLDRNLVLLGVLDQLAAAAELPLAPRRDDLDAGPEVIRGELEPDLVVALAGRAV